MSSPQNPPIAPVLEDAPTDAGETGEPTDEEIRFALPGFTAAEWEGFMDRFAECDSERLRAYLDKNEDELVGVLGREEWRIILVRASQRGVDLFEERRPKIKWSKLSDVYWVEFFEVLYAIHKRPYSHGRCRKMILLTS